MYCRYLDSLDLEIWRGVERESGLETSTMPGKKRTGRARDLGDRRIDRDMESDGLGEAGLSPIAEEVSSVEGRPGTL